MTIKITDDLDIFFEDFAIVAAFQLKTFKVIFENDFRIAYEGVETSTPAASCKSSDIEDLGLKHGNELTINGGIYKITGIQPDGTGITLLLLENIDE